MKFLDMLPTLPGPLFAVAVAALSGQADTPTLHRMPVPLASFGAATTSEAIYVLGGHVGGAHEHSRDNLSAQLIRYPLDDLDSPEELPGGVGLQSVALVAHDDTLYRIGGMQARNAPDEEDDLLSVDTFARYESTLGQWDSVAALPQGRSSHDAIVHDGTLYVFGGWQLGSGEPHWYTHGLSLDLNTSTPTWVPIDQPFARRALAVASAHGRLFAIGGLTIEGKTSSRVDVFDPANGTWTRGKDLPVTGFGATAFGTNEGLFFLGRDGNLWRLDEADGDWQFVRSTAFGRFFGRLVPRGPSQLAIIGGASPQGRPALLEEVSTQPSLDETVVSSVSYPNPGRARQRQAAFLYESRLYLFGGNVHAAAHKFAPEDFTQEGWSLDLLTGEWRSEAAFPAPRQSMRAVLLDGATPSGLVAGGFGPGEGGNRSWSEAQSFDLISRAWHPAGFDLPLPLTQFGWVAAENSLWTVGGIVYTPDGEADFSPGDALYQWEFGDRQGFAEASAPLTQRRRAFGWTAIEDALYVIGGMSDDFEMVHAPERVELTSGAIQAVSVPDKHRLGPQVATLGGKVYVTGGTVEADEGRKFDNSLEAYDPSTGAWEVVVQELPVNAQHLRLLAWGERLLAFSTAREGWIDIAFVTPLGARPEGGGFRHP